MVRIAAAVPFRKTKEYGLRHLKLTMKKIRVGAVSYFNTKPLVHGLDALTSDCELSFDLPSRLAAGLNDGTYDVALLPSIESMQNPEFTIVSDACIGSRGAVWSVKLLSRVPLESIQTLALDEGSRTSVALVQVLLKKRFGISPQTTVLGIDEDWHQFSADAALVIGDRAMSSETSDFVHVWDLGEEWYAWTELPFVFAMWTVRPFESGELDLRRIAGLLTTARDSGLRSLNSIAERGAEDYGLSRETALRYLRDNLHFYLGPRERAGLDLFYQHAAAIDCAPRTQALRFYDCSHS